MKIAIIGAGAVGGYYGARLAAAGNDVHFLFHKDYDFVTKHGFTVDSTAGNIRLEKVNAYEDASKMPMCELVIVALKVVANSVLGKILPNILAPNGVVLTLQNGLGADDEIAKTVGPDRVLGGLCFICSNKVGPGHVRHLDYGAVNLGEYAPDFGARGITSRLEKTAQLFTDAKIEAHTLEDLVLGRWQKLCWNIPYNGSSVILNETTDKMVANPLLRPLFRELMEEVSAGAKALGRNIPSTFLDKMEALTDKMTPYATSMMLDFRAKRPMEVEAIYGEPLRRAAAAGVKMPHVETLYRELSFINSRFGG